MRGLGRSGGGCHVFVEGSGLADRGDREGEVRAWGRRPRMVGGSGGAWKILFVKKKKKGIREKEEEGSNCGCVGVVNILRHIESCGTCIEH